MLMKDTSNNFWSPGLIFFLKALEGQALPGIKAHLELTPYRAVDNVFPEAPANARQGAVAVIISLYHQQPVLVLTKRVDYKGVHGGQISFPGGKQELGDADLLFTAQRETLEETGISLEAQEYIRPLSGIYIPPSNFHVHPFLFVTEKKMEVVPNSEVDYPILANMDVLLNEGLQTTTIRLSDGMVINNAPCFIYENEIIWGATAAILNELRWILRDFTGTKAP